jgi:glycosyltransferase involved in cell wall biosynthesis
MQSETYSPLVSVLLPVYNGQDYLQETLDSIASQDLLDFELIVIDDGSTDGSWNLLMSWVSGCALSVRCVRKPLNMGVCAALTDASILACGRYIAQIGQDDVWSSEHLSLLCALLESNPNSSAAFGDVTYIDSRGAVIESNIFHHSEIDDEQESLFAKLIAGNFLCAPASMFRRKHFEVSYWGVSNERLQDYELWLNLLLTGQFVFSKHKTCFYRLHDGNLSSGNRMRLQSEYELLMTLMRILMGDRMKCFYMSLVDDGDRQIRFVRALSSSLGKVSAYCSGVTLIHAAILERISLWEAKYAHEINAMRVMVVQGFGLMRKALALKKVSSTHLLRENIGIPFLVPAHPFVGSYYISLVETGCFQDGRHIDLTEVDAPFLYACHEDQIDQSMAYDSFSLAARERRVIVLQAARAGSHEYGYAIGTGQRFDHVLVDNFLKFMEETHRSFYRPRSIIG